MLWEITAYNHTVWTAKTQCSLWEAVEQFKKETGLHEMDIKRIENLH